MNLDFDTLKAHIPPYLTLPMQQGLIEELKRFPHNVNYYTDHYKNELLQGDGLTKLPIIDVGTAQRSDVFGVVLSNSCDVDPINKRLRPARLVFAPLIPLNKYYDLLRGSGVSQDRIDSQMQSIRSQHVTNVLYFPRSSSLSDEFIAYLDDIHNIPLSTVNSIQPPKIFTLSQIGFYLFSIKLSVHFCRFHENILRDTAPIVRQD